MWKPTPGAPLFPGMLTQYKFEDGATCDAAILVVAEHNNELTRYNVVAAIFAQGLLDDDNGARVGRWQYDVESGYVLWIPPGPPW